MYVHVTIRAEIDRFIAAYNRADVDTLMSCYAEDLVKLRQGGGAETKQQTADRVRATLRTYNGSLRVTVDEVILSGPIAFVRGSLQVTLTPRSGDPIAVDRRYIELWRNERGAWKVARAMDNAS